MAFMLSELVGDYHKFGYVKQMLKQNFYLVSTDSLNLMARRCHRLLSNVELVAQKPREFGIKVNTDLEKIPQSSVLTAGAEGIIRGLVLIRKCCQSRVPQQQAIMWW